MHVLSIDVGCGHYALCCARLPDVRVERLESWRLGSTKSTPASQLIDRLLAHFKTWSVLSTWTPDVVLIEQQMRGAHINLALAFATYTYCRTRFPHATVRFAQPSLKFSAYARFVPGLPVAPVPTEYAKRKRFAVKLAQDVLVASNLPSLETLCPLSDAKKDDLADAFLQCFCVPTDMVA